MTQSTAQRGLRLERPCLGSGESVVGMPMRPTPALAPIDKRQPLLKFAPRVSLFYDS